LEWRSIEEVAREAGLSKDQTRRILKTLSTFNRVEESNKGWRINPKGLIHIAFSVQAYLNEQISRFTKPS
jgi:DNA-binding IclR family transcriptional regulator